MIYNFNLGIGWASSGVEYAQAYRGNIFRKIGQKAKFVFTDMFPSDNIEHMTANIGFEDDEIIWLYSYFTDTKIAPVSYSLKKLEDSFGQKANSSSRKGNNVRYEFEGSGNFCVAYMVNDESEYVHRVEIVSGGYLIRKDYYTYCRIYSEYYAPLDGKAHLYLRRFFNEDGSVAYEEIIDDKNVFYKFNGLVLYSKEELVAYLVKKLALTKEDIVIIDRTTGIGQSILQNVGEAKVGIVIHAEHFSESGTDDDNILWNNYYEYAFSQNRKVDFYITATDTQKYILEEQFKKYMGVEPNIVAIPVGSIDELKAGTGIRKRHSLITASRLASEKHVDWLVEAVVRAREDVPDVSLDIYGTGAEKEKIEKKIRKYRAEEYIKLKGHCDLAELYCKYEAYLSGSTSEGFGLSVLEAIGSGLPVIGFNVRYGNQTFVRDEINGHLIEYDKNGDYVRRVENITKQIVRLFTQDNLVEYRKASYERAQEFLTTEVQNKWKILIETMV